MNINTKSITTALLAAGLSFSVFTMDPVFSEPTTVEAATVQQKKAKKVKKIKAANRKKIAQAKRVQIKKNNAAKAVKAKDKKLNQLNAQKRAQQKRVKSLNNTINEKQNGIAKATPNRNYNNPSNIYNAKHRITRSEQLPSTLVSPRLPQNEFYAPSLYYGYIKTSADTSSKINGRLTAAQQKEITDYTITLLNSYLRSKGMAEAKWSTQMHAQTLKMMQEQYRRDFAPYESGMTTLDSWEIFTPEKGLDYSKDTTFDLAPSNKTVLGMKVAILNELTDIFYHPAGYGSHTILDASGKQLSAVVDLNGSYNKAEKPYKILFVTAKANGRVYQNNQRLTSTSKHASKKSSAKNEIAARNAANKKIASLNKQIRTRNAALNRSMNKKFKANAAEFNKTKKQANRVMANQLRRV